MHLCKAGRYFGKNGMKSVFGWNRRPVFLLLTPRSAVLPHTAYRNNMQEVFYHKIISTIIIILYYLHTTVITK